jgi:hypothetical protein
MIRRPYPDGKGSPPTRVGQELGTRWRRQRRGCCGGWAVTGLAGCAGKSLWQIGLLL